MAEAKVLRQICAPVPAPLPARFVTLGILMHRMEVRIPEVTQGQGQNPCPV